MATSKSKKEPADNVITITIAKDHGKIDFKNHVTGFELMTAYIILKENIDFHFTGPEQAKLALQVYDRIENVEEVGF